MISEHVRAAFEHRPGARLPRGELWLGTNIFTDFKIEDNVYNHLELCHCAGMDLVSLPAGETQSLNYQCRRFSVSDLQMAARSDLFVIAVLDGPFQRLVNRKGLLQVLGEFARNMAGTVEAINEEAEGVVRLIDACVHNGANAVVIGDDLAHGKGMFISRNTFDHTMWHHYKTFTEMIHRGSAYAILHSCGNMTDLIASIVSSGFDGLSCENECADIASIKSSYGNYLTLFAGISCEILEGYPSSTRENEDTFVELVSRLSKDGGLVLSSSSGLYSSRVFHNIKRLYALADKLWHSS